MTNNLNETLTLFRERAKENPFDTWFICENKDVAATVAKNMQSAYLPGRFTSVSGIAIELCKKLSPKTRIIGSEEQFLIFSKIIKDTNILENTSDNTVQQIIKLYNLLTENSKTLSGKNISASTKVKFEKLNKIFAEYKKWCLENKCIDRASVVNFVTENAEEQNYHLSFLIYYGRLETESPQYKFFKTLYPDFIHVVPAEPEKLADLKPAALLYPDKKTELRTILEKISSLMESGVSDNDIVLILPSMSETRPLLTELADDYYIRGENGLCRKLNFRTVKGYAITNIPIIQAVIAYLSVCSHDCKVEDLITLIDSPYFSTPENLTASELKEVSIRTGITKDKKKWDAIDEKLNKRFINKLEETDKSDTKEIDKLKSVIEHNIRLKESIAEITGLAYNQKMTWENHVDYVTDILTKTNLIKINSDSLPDDDKKAREGLMRLFGKISTSSMSKQKCTTSEFARAVTRFCQNNVYIYPKYNHAHPGFLVAPVESAVPDMADYVFIADLTSNHLPKIESTLPYLTAEESRVVWDGKIRDSLEEQKHQFEIALLSAKKELYLSCSEKDSSKNFTPSPYLTNRTELLKAGETVPVHSRLENQKIAGEYLINQNGEKCRELFGLTPLEDSVRKINVDIKRVGGYAADFSCDKELCKEFSDKYLNENKQYSPSELETYAECPFQWYLKYHLKIIPQEENDSMSIVLGNTVHEALCRFFTEYRKPVTQENKEEAFDILSAIFKDEMNKTSFETPEWKAKLQQYLGEYDVSSSLREYLEIEIKYSEEGYKTDAKNLERRFRKIELKGEDGSVMKLQGAVDRIITNPKDNTFSVIDYKTGDAPKIEEKVVNQKTALQLPLYMKAFADESGLTMNDGIYLQIKSTPDKVKDNSRLSSAKTVTVEDIVDGAVKKCFEIRDSIITGHCGIANPCIGKYCGYKRICRYRLSSGGDEE